MICRLLNVSGRLNLIWLSRLTGADVWVDPEAVPSRCCEGSCINTNTWPEAPREHMLHSSNSGLCESQTDRAKTGCCHFHTKRKTYQRLPPPPFFFKLS